MACHCCYICSILQLSACISQMCEKQCRDANGFKCHMTSESHLRQMKIFSENAKGFMDKYSTEFIFCFLQTLRQRHTTKRVNANHVYQEVIGDKQHIHMNSTRWATLTDFVMYLGKTGKCVVDETERGWWVMSIYLLFSISSKTGTFGLVPFRRHLDHQRNASTHHPPFRPFSSEGMCNTSKMTLVS